METNLTPYRDHAANSSKYHSRYVIYLVQLYKHGLCAIRYYDADDNGDRLLAHSSCNYINKMNDRLLLTSPSHSLLIIVSCEKIRAVFIIINHYVADHWLTDSKKN